ncbi:outer membrane protein [Ruegeria marisrubri]|nr:porin family protein [Ruegeria marisrubri]
MNFGIKTAFCLGLAMATPGLANAQQSDWSYEASIYLFTPETNTTIATPSRTLNATLSFSDALENLDIAFMGAFGASNGQWSFIADYMLTDISFGNPTPGPAFSSLDTSVKTQIFNAYAAYRVYEAPTVAVDLGAGLRWYKTDTEMTLQPGALPGGTTVAKGDWVDPLIAIRARFQFNEKWAGTAFADYGGFESGSDTWQVLLTADYALNERWLLRGGYRYIEVNHAIDGADYSFDQSGPIFGATYRF